MSVLSAEEVLVALQYNQPIYSYSTLFPDCFRLSTPPIPKEGGIYAWYFKEVPPLMPDVGCTARDGKGLFYIGQTDDLNRRIKEHYEGTVGQSTLRLSLGVLFEDQMKATGIIGLNREGLLTKWMKENAFVCWIGHKDHAIIEKDVIGKGWLPLNINHSLHPFSQELKAMRNQF